MDMNIRYTKLRFTLQMTEDTQICQHKVSALRGGIGEMLLQQYCLSDRNCENCGFREDCPVSRFFYHPLKIKPPYIQKGESLGYVIECNDRRKKLAQGESFSFQMLFFGSTIIYFPDIMQALYRLGQDGLGREKAHFMIQSVQNELCEPVLKENVIYNDKIRTTTINEYIKRHEYLKTKACIIRFITPLSVKYHGQWLQQFQENALIESTVRRLYMLNCLEGNEVDSVLPQELPQIKKQSVRKGQIIRYSNTHQSKIILRGIYGECMMDNISEEVFRYLLAGQLVHIGKNTTMGFGQYQIEPI